MKVLIDECSPKALKRHLADFGHHCVTVQEAGWAGKKNGELPNQIVRPALVFAKSLEF